MSDALAGLPSEFIRMLAVAVDPYADNPNKPLDDFFDALMRAQSFRRTRKVAENDLGSNLGQGGPLTMTSEMQKTPNALTATSNKLPANADGWDAAAADIANKPMKGQMIRFDSGAYFIGKEKTLLKETKRRFVAMEQREGWTFLKKDTPAEYVMRPIGEPKPPRPDSFADKSTWPDGLDGNPSDPWKYTHFVYLLDPPTAEIFTFTSNTTGGRIGIDDLTQQIKTIRTAEPGAVPIVELQSAPWKTNFGIKQRPFFKVVGWHLKKPEASAPELLPDNSGGDDGDSAKTVNDLNDEIPW